MNTIFKYFFKILTIFCAILVIIICSDCSHKHKYSEEKINPTCTEKGYTIYTCECGNEYKDKFIEPFGHTFSTWKIIQEASYDEVGIKERNCEKCDYKEEEIIPLIIHVHNYKQEVILPTCKNEGYTVYLCECGDTYSDDFIPKKSHSFSEWNIIKESSIEEEGIKERICSVCLEAEEEIIPKIEAPESVNITYDLNGGLFNSGYISLDELRNDFLNDFNKYSGTTATLTNFLKDSTSSIKTALSNLEMLKKWQWLFIYMFDDVKEYNSINNTLSIGYVSDSLDLFPKLIALDTTVITDGTKGPNFRTLIRSYLHGMMNCSKGDPVGNATFSKYVPDFNDEELVYNLLLSQYELDVIFNRGDILPVPVREYYDFIGWEDREGNIVNIPLKDVTLKAVWKEGVPVEEIKITNKIAELDLYSTYQLTWQINPDNAVCKKVRFESSDESILKIDNNGLITTLKKGKVIVKIISLGLTNKQDEFTLNVVTPGYFDISYETNSYVVVDSSIRLNAIYINSIGETQEVMWESLNEDIASVDDTGLVKGINPGNVYIRAKISDTVCQDFLVTVINQEVNVALQTVLDAHNSNIFVEYDLGIGAGTPVYYMDIIGSISKILYNEELIIDDTYNKATNEKFGADLENRILESVEFITVHYTGSMSSADTAEAIAKYFAKPLSSVKTSIHYSTGNDGIFRGMDEVYRAAHAGDDGSLETVAKFEWLDTPVVVLPTDPEFPVVTITKNATFAINGRDTLIKVPNETKFGRGMVTDSKWLNEMGIAVNVKDGKYQIGTSWWCYTQVWEGRICSNGGNRNSIGIESCVNKGSDLWYTWQKTAMLCADIMYRYNLDITRVKGHHFFSAKNCPQPMLENDLEIWWEFIELVKAEYEKLTKCSEYNFSFASNSEYLNDHGRVIKQDLMPQMIEYTVTITKGNETQTITLGSILEGSYSN